MPLSELNDYILLVNEEIEKEQEEANENSNDSQPKVKPIGTIANNSTKI